MKAAIYTRYGTPDDLQFTEVETPTPTDNEVLIKVHAASVNMYDWRLLEAVPFLVRLRPGWLLRPKYPILGADAAGVVEAVGKNVTQFQPGDAVYGDLSGYRNGGFAEYVCAPEHLLARKPAHMTFEQAAAFPMAAVTALQGLRDQGRLQAGQRVVIQGASGGVGTFAVQIAKALGAEVTAVCSTRNVEMVWSLGADHVIDYKQADFTRNGQRYDLILGVNGYHPIRAYKRSLNPGGRYVMAGGSGAQLFEALALGPMLSMTGGKTLGALTAVPKQDDLVFLGELFEAGKVVPVVDKCYPLSETAEAIRSIGEGHARGKVVVLVAQPDKTQARLERLSASPVGHLV